MSNNKGERGMWKNRNKIWLTIIVAFVCMFGSVGMAFAAETGTPVTTESMEIRTGEKVGLRTISAVDKAYVEKLRSEGKNVTYGTVALPATVLEKVNGTLEIGKSYTYNKKVYKVLNIPGEEIWKTTEDKIYFTGVLTGISGSGFNTRYAVRSYISVDGKVTYGNTLTQSPYTIAQDMISSEDVATSQKSWLATNVIDACDDAKKVTKETLTITSADLKNGKYTLEATSKIRNYKKVIVDSSVNNGEIILDNIRVRNLEVAADASCTITANNVSFDKISKVAGKSRTAGNLVLNLGAGSNVTELSASSNMTITGDLKIAKVTVDNKVENFVVNTPAEKLTVSENASGSKIEVNKMVEDAVLAGENSTDLSSVVKGLQALSEGLGQLSAQTETAGEQYLAGVDSGMEQLKSGIGTQVGDSLSQLREGADRLTQGSGEVSRGVEQLTEAAPALAGGIQSAKDGAGALKTQGTEALVQGARQLDEGLGRLVQGSSDLDKGVQEMQGQLPALSARFPIPM